MVNWPVQPNPFKALCSQEQDVVVAPHKRNLRLLKLSEVAKQIFCTLNPPVDQSNRSIENRSKCYKQLSERNDLKVAGVLTEEEYVAEKSAIMNALKKL